MLEATTALKDALVYSHQLALEVTVEGVDLPILDGSVTLDHNAASFGSCDLEIVPDPAWVPTGPDSLLAPYGNEITIKRGVEYPDGTPDLVQLGVFRIDETTVSSTAGELTISVSGLDRSAGVIEDVFEEAGTLDKGTDCIDQIKLFLALHDFTYVSAAGGDDYWGADNPHVKLPLMSYDVGDDRWDWCLGLAEAAQLDLYFDSFGRLTLAPLIPPSATFSVQEGEGGILIGADKSWGRDNACNRVVVSAENASGNEPMYGEAKDTTVGSPTEYLAGPGHFGHVTFEWSSDLLPDPEQDATGQQNQVTRVAENILNKKKGISQSISFEALWAPIAPHDTILITREELGVDEEHVVDSVTLPLIDGTITGETRVVRVL